MNKLGSLFDGSGGFPLAGALCGIEPVWAAEVEPYPIAVTRSRFPKMKHLGDISKANGAEIEPVDIITFGSPCQDLSVAGKRAGLKHEANGDEETTRSGLFMEAVRIIKEMRKATNGKYPRFALWENVPGAFSSNKGEDFRVVCEELIKIVEPSASMPPVPKGGWNYADNYRGDGWSLAYRVLDAQYWGVPQRRRRIYLVADLRGECAHQILFERQGLRGYFAEGRTPWQTTPADAQASTGADDREGESRGGLLTPSDSGYPDGLLGGRGLDAVGVINAIGGNAENSQETETFPTLTNGTAPGFNNAVAVSTHIIDNVGGQAEYAKASEVNGTLRAGAQGCIAYAVENHPADSRVNIDESGKVQTLTSRMGTGGGNVPMVLEPFVKSARARSTDDATTWKEGKVANTLNTFDQGEARANELVVQASNFIDVEMEIAVRKYEVNVPLLIECLRDHKAGSNFSNKDIAEQLNRPITEVEHWFRTDNCFAVPAPEIWYKLKELLGIQTDEFDQSIMTFEYKGGTYDMRNRIHVGETAPTLTCGSGNNLHLLPTEPAVAYGLDRASFNQGQNAKFDFSITEGQQPTLTARGPGAVCCTTGSFTHTTEEVSPTLMARDWKDPTVVCTHYIVRRLTPTECARLQGFADWWGVVEKKDTLTDEEYRFWLEVRNTHAVINGKKIQEYTPKQMLTWYNKLWTDSAEYKMWGNGIALPTALYCLQGVVEAISKEDDDEDWML